MNLQRALEPKTDHARDESYQYRTMDHRAVNQGFVADLIAAGPVGPQVIDLGCGPAEIPILLCQQSEASRVLAIDSEVEMLEIAKVEIDIAGMLDRITLHHADANAMEAYEDAMADTVISNSVIHHLDHPVQGLATALRLLRPGGRLFIRDLVRPATLDAVEALVGRHAGSQSPFAQQLLRQSLRAALTIAEIRQVVSDLGLDPGCVELTSDRHWTLDWSCPQ